MKKVLSIAGSDCSGGAGIQADLKTFSAHGVFGMSVIVSVVAENTSRVIDIQDITPDMIKKQIDAVFEDIEVDAVKIGMLSTPACMEAVAEQILRYQPRNIVIDPVMYAKNGCALMQPESVDTLIKTIIPLADVLTPNIPEAEKISGLPIATVKDMETAARRIHAMGCKAVVIKGGHAVGSPLDVLYDGEGFTHFETARIDTKNTHGTGCTFSSAIASQLAKGCTVKEAVQKAKAYVTTAIAHAMPIGKGNGPTHHFYDLYQNGLKEEKMLNRIILQLDAIKATKPLVHHITNYVTVNDCANACLAIGASPIMADEAAEVCDITAIASSLVINIGTLNERTVASMLKAGMKANGQGIPVVLDPVGAGASGFRNETAAKLLDSIRFTVIRGNLSEIRYLTESCANTKGVDVSEADMVNMAQSGVELAMECAKKYGCIAAITGKTDVISDGQKVLCIDNGHEALSSVTGTGCMCTTLIGAFCGANSDPFVSAAGGILSMGIAGELAFERAGSLGVGSFRVALIDEIGKLNGTTILERAKIHEKAC